MTSRILLYRLKDTWFTVVLAASLSLSVLTATASAKLRHQNVKPSAQPNLPITFLTLAPTPTPQPVKVTLPTDSFDTSVASSTVIIKPMITTSIDPSLNYIGFQADFFFDSAVIGFASSPVVELDSPPRTGTSLGAC